MYAPYTKRFLITKTAIVFFVILGQVAAADLNMTAIETAAVMLPCSTSVVKSPVNWKFCTSMDDIGYYVSYRGRLSDYYAPRFSLDGWSVIISNVSINDCGIYVCVEDGGYGPEHYISLKVVREDTSTKQPTSVSSVSEYVEDQPSAITVKPGIIIIFGAIVFILLSLTLLNTMLLVRRRHQHQCRKIIEEENQLPEVQSEQSVLLQKLCRISESETSTDTSLTLHTSTDEERRAAATQKEPPHRKAQMQDLRRYSNDSK